MINGNSAYHHGGAVNSVEDTGSSSPFFVRVLGIIEQR